MIIAVYFHFNLFKFFLMLNQPSNNAKYTANLPGQTNANRPLRILTNMVFWQSPVWTENVRSIHPDHGRHMKIEPAWWKQAWTLFNKRTHADVVVTLGVRESMAYGFLCWITGSSSRQIMTEVFIDEPQSGAIWRMKTWLYGKISGRCIGILTNSSDEIHTMARRYGIEENKLVFVPLNSTLSNRRPSEKDDGYILAAGRTLRDYPTLLKAVEKLPVRVVIICGKDDTCAIPRENQITVLREVAFSDYTDYIERCTMLALPLRPTGRATGQVVMLDAMAVGKPVIVTRTPGTIDYIQHGSNGLLVDVGSVEQMREAIMSLWKAPELRKQLGMKAYDDVQRLYSFDTHAALKLNAIHMLYAAYAGTTRT